MKNTPRLRISDGKIAKCLIEARPGVDQKTTRARASLCPVQTNILLLPQQAGARSSTNL